MQAALDLLDEAGMEGLTVRALASRLGAQAPALYWHVRNKQALLDEMATLIWRRVSDVMAGLPAGTPWREIMSAYAVTIRAELLGHRDGAKAFSGTTLTDPEVVRRQEVTLRHPDKPGLHPAGRGPRPAADQQLHHRLLRRGAGGPPGDRVRRRPLP